jgi:hypothetical protein
MKSQATRLYPFVPSGAHFSRSIEFFEAMGFEKVWEVQGLARLRFGTAVFLLQDIEVREWQTNQMIVFEVTDLDIYWSELEAKDLSVQFPGVSMKPPKEFPWGREIHIIDLAGVCWHVRDSVSPV